MKMSKQEFYQEKYNYYRKMNMWVIIAASICSIGYYLSDCYLFGEIRTTTLIPRMVIVIPLILFLWLNTRTTNYRVMVPMSYLVGHGTMWGTIWACYYLDDLRFACVGFIIIHFVFMILGITAPIIYGVIGYGLLFADIIIADTFVHYPDYEMMFLLGVPLYVGVCIFNAAIERTYRDQLSMKMKLEENYKHDSLTGAYNRNVMPSLISDNNLFACSSTEEIAVVMYDLDKFKQVNDTYGHAVGDEVLVKVTKAVESKLRSDEYLIRWGGEEFIVIIKGSNGKLEERAQEFRREVEAVETSAGRVTISVGVAKYQGENYQKTIKNADAALYEAKDRGRNQVVMYQAE